MARRKSCHNWVPEQEQQKALKKHEKWFWRNSCLELNVLKSAPMELFFVKIIQIFGFHGVLFFIMRMEVDMPEFEMEGFQRITCIITILKVDVNSTA